MKTLSFLILSFLIYLPGLTHAQDAIVDDAFDPFADYSDFVEATTEETDVNFFKFGRMISAGAQLGMRNFSGELGNVFGNDNLFGGFFTYYLTIQMAVQISYTSGTHSAVLNLEEEIDESFEGSSSLGVLSLHGKYFLNTQNFTKAVSKFNPYVIGGFSQISRRITEFSNPTVSGNDNSGSFDFGFGGEYLFNENRNFVSLQFMYFATDFPNENREIVVTRENGSTFDTGRFLAGDMFTISVMLGINY